MYDFQLIAKEIFCYIPRQVRVLTGKIIFFCFHVCLLNNAVENFLNFFHFQISNFGLLNKNSRCIIYLCQSKQISINIRTSWLKFRKIFYRYSWRIREGYSTGDWTITCNEESQEINIWNFAYIIQNKLYNFLIK